MKKFAVFGNPIKQSISPQIHQHFAEQAGLPIRYEKCLSQRETFEGDIVQFFSERSVVGCNITAPFKEQAFALADKVHASARDAQAANTLHRIGDELHAHNTDGAGLVKDLLRALGSLEGANVLLLGAGGAARGVIRPLLAERVASLTIANRTLEKAERLVALGQSSKIEACTLTAITTQFDIVINSTSASLSGGIPELGLLDLGRSALTYDMSYKAEPTPFLQFAAEKGCKLCVDGLGMLIGQAAVSFYIWTGFSPDTTQLLSILRKGMSA